MRLEDVPTRPGPTISTEGIGTTPPPVYDDVMTRPLDDATDDLLENARLSLKAAHDANRYEEQSRRLARRIVIAFVLIFLTAAVFFIGVPLMGVDLPPVVPVMCFITIVVGSVMAHIGDSPEHRAPPPKRDDDGGCAVGCCPGPRPLKMFGESNDKR